MVAEKGISLPILSAHNASQQSYKLIPSLRKTRGVKTLGGSRQEGMQATVATQNIFAIPLNFSHFPPFHSLGLSHSFPVSHANSACVSHRLLLYYLASGSI